MNHHQFVAFAEQQDATGQKDAMGFSWATWLLAIRRPDGEVARDTADHQIFETQADYKTRIRVIPVGQTLELFA